MEGHSNFQFLNRAERLTAHKGSPMLPDYIIYDELKKEREKRERERERERPRLEIPSHRPYRDDAEEKAEQEDSSERGVAIIQF